MAKSKKDTDKLITINMEGRGSYDYSFDNHLKDRAVRVINYNTNWTDSIRTGMIKQGGAKSVEFIVKEK